MVPLSMYEQQLRIQQIEILRTYDRVLQTPSKATSTQSGRQAAHRAANKQRERRRRDGRPRRAAARAPCAAHESKGAALIGEKEQPRRRQHIALVMGARQQPRQPHLSHI
eukprot:2301169-Pleurochrysis_carterae.AAC.4